MSLRIHENGVCYFMFLILRVGILYSAILYLFGAAALKVMEFSLSLKIRFIFNMSLY